MGYLFCGIVPGMGGKETIGDYYQRLDDSLSSKAQFVNGSETPVRMQEMVRMAEVFKSHGLSYPELSFVDPESAIIDDQKYPINSYKMNFDDNVTFNRLVTLSMQKRSEYQEAGIQGEMIEEILGLIVDTTLHEISEREKKRKSLVEMYVRRSEGLKSRRPKNSVKISDDVRGVVERVKKEGKLTPEALQRSGISGSTISSIIRGQERVSSSTAAGLAIVAGVPVDEVVADKGTAPKVKRNMMVICRELFNRENVQHASGVQVNSETDSAVERKTSGGHL